MLTLVLLFAPHFIPVGQIKRGQGSESEGRGKMRRRSHKILVLVHTSHSNFTSTIQRRIHSIPGPYFTDNNRRRGNQTCSVRASQWICLFTQCLSYKCWREDDWAQWRGVPCSSTECPVKQGISDLLIRVSETFR